MPQPSVLVPLLALAAVLAACGGGEDRPIPRTACDYGGYCNEYEGVELDVPSTDASCTQSGGTALAACPAEGVLGLCTRLRETTTIRGHYYDPAIVDTMRSSCIALGDAWTTP